jgi:hypothetical protein
MAVPISPPTQVSTAAPGLLAVRNPTNPACCIYQKTGSGNCNEILPACMDPNTALMNAYWPLPNFSVPGLGNYTNNTPPSSPTMSRCPAAITPQRQEPDHPEHHP